MFSLDNSDSRYSGYYRRALRRRLYTLETGNLFLYSERMQHRSTTVAYGGGAKVQALSLPS